MPLIILMALCRTACNWKLHDCTYVVKDTVVIVTSKAQVLKCWLFRVAYLFIDTNSIGQSHKASEEQKWRDWFCPSSLDKAANIAHKSIINWGFCTALFSPSTCSWHSSQSAVSTAAKAQTKLHCTRGKPHTYSLELLSSIQQDTTIPACFTAPALRSGLNLQWSQNTFSPSIKF